MKLRVLAGVLSLTLLLSSCATVSTGEVGVYKGPAGLIQEAALGQGMYQDVVGDVQVYSVREIQIPITGLTPQTADNSALEDLDLTITYSVVPGAVPGLIAKYGTRYNGRNEETGESYPLSEYVKRFVLPAVTGAVAQIPSLEVNKKLDVLAVDIRKRLMESLKAEGLDDSIDISSVLIGNIKLPKVITDAQNLTVKANSELTAATKKVATAEQEALRIQKINSALTDRYVEMQRIEMLKEAARNSKGWIMDASKQSIMFNPN